MKLFRDEGGQTLVFTALLGCCLMGFMALAIDVGVLIRAQRRVQTAADAAAIAGTLEYYYHGSGNAATVAKTAATNNGITNTNQVTVNIPPVNGWHTGPEYLEVIIQQPNPTIFMATFAGLFPGGATNFSPMTVAARAVAGIVPSASCVYLLDQTNAQSLNIQGNATVSSPNCTWTVDSSSPQAFCITGKNSLNGFDSPGVILASGQEKNGKCNKLYGGASTGGSSLTDPLAKLITWPDPTKTSVCNPNAGGNVVTAATVSGSTPTLPTPITATTGGLTANQSYSIICFNAGAGVPTTLSNVTLGGNSPGGENALYIFENGLVLSGTNTIYGTVDLANGPFCQGTVNGGGCNFNSASGGPGMTITAPANGDGLNPPNSNTYAWNGLAIVVPPTNSSLACDNSYKGVPYAAGSDPDSCLQIQFGSGSGTLNGMIYAPDTALYLQDSGGSVGVTSLIVDSISINSTLNITANYSYSNPESPLNQVELVE